MLLANTILPLISLIVVIVEWLRNSEKESYMDKCLQKSLFIRAIPSKPLGFGAQTVEADQEI